MTRSQELYGGGDRRPQLKQVLRESNTGEGTASSVEAVNSPLKLCHVASECPVRVFGSEPRSNLL